MRHLLCCLCIALTPIASGAGPIARQYALGFNEVSWGDSVAEVVAKHPGGDHFFARGRGAHRDYSVPDDRPLFGIARTNSRDFYFFDETDSVESVSLTFPFEERQSLMGMLVLTFGPVRHTVTKGIEIIYFWAADDGTSIALRETSNPTYGILTLDIMGPNSTLYKNDPECASAASKNQKK